MKQTNGSITKRDQQTLIDEITQDFSSHVSSDAKYTILTIRNLIESNSRVEESIDELHTSINNSNIQNEKLQKRIYFLTIVAVSLTLIQAAAVIIELSRRF
jgi:hypothetical protein